MTHGRWKFHIIHCMFQWINKLQRVACVPRVSLGRISKIRTVLWVEKINRNVQRDNKRVAALNASEWKVMII